MVMKLETSSLVVWRTAMVLCLFLLLQLGCGKRKTIAEVSERRSREFCNRLIRDPNAPQYVRAKAREVIQMRENSRVDPVPVLLLATFYKHAKTGRTYLVLGVSDEDDDLTGFVMKEHPLSPTSRKSVLEERYAAFQGTRSFGASYMILPVQLRAHNETMNKEAWNRYLDGSTRDTRSMPTIWISDPKVSPVEVQLYDAAGHRSEWVRVQGWLPSVKAPTTKNGGIDW